MLVTLNPFQNGFTSTPGCQLNTAIVSGVLKHAKEKKTTAVITMLDITKAFDMIGHLYLSKSLEEHSIPTKLKSLILNLFSNNFTRVHCKFDKTEPVYFKRGLMQGAPLSPLLFNICIDFILRECTEPTIRDHFGYQMSGTLSPLSILGFADDTNLLNNNIHSAITMVQVVKDSLANVGLSLNLSRSQIIYVEKGKLFETEIQIDDLIIKSIEPNKKLRYLGVNFNSEIIVDEQKIISSLNNDLNFLAGTSMLSSHEKLMIINQYIWPKLIYSFQTTPLDELNVGFL